MRIVFIRHGDPNYELDCLTELGHQQAVLAAERLKDEGIVEIYSSSCGRSVETAQYTADILRLSVTSFDFMREINWGNDALDIPHAGHPWATVDDMVTAGEPLVNSNWASTDRWKDNVRLLSSCQTVSDGLDRWLLSLGYQRQGDYYRVVGCSTNKTVAMFSHGGASTAALAHLFNLPFPYACMCIRAYFTSITIVTLSDDPSILVSPQFELVNDARHVQRKEFFFGR